MTFRLMVAATAVGVVGLSWWVGSGSSLGPSFVMVAMLLLVFLSIGTRLRTHMDPWLPTLFTIAYAGKVLAATARWGTTSFLYGRGDSFAYHAAGTLFSSSWRQFEVPEIVGRSMGTRFVENVTALLYAPYVPHMLGGFFLFASIAFIGQTFFYLAFRRTSTGALLKPYALFVFFVPTLLFWPASIGKDSLMVFFLGLTFYGAVRFFERFRFRFILVIALGLWGATVIRSHVALLAAAAVIVTVLLMKKPGPGLGLSVRRVLFAVAAMVGAIGVATLFADAFGLGAGGDGLLSIDLTLEDLDPVVCRHRTTDRAGWIKGGRRRGRLMSSSFPAAFARVLFAPFPWQAHNSQALFAAAEGMIVFIVFLWALPSILRAFGSYRRHPHLMLALLYTLGFTLAFSAILNLGIMTRQRGQVMAVFLALCFGAKELAMTSTQEDTTPDRYSPALADR